MFAIVIHEKGGAERREVFEGTEISVGRVQGNDLMLPKGNVSKRHARLLYREGRIIVTDLNSTNGTYVNRHRIKQATIVREGDRLYIGDFVLRIEALAAADASVAVPLPAASVSVPPRQTLASSSNEPQSGATVRPSAQEFEEDSIAREPIRSSPMASPGPLPESTSTVARPTHEDLALATPRGLLDAAGVLVDRVVRGLNPSDLEADVTSELGTRVERALREASLALSLERSSLVSTALERVIALARAELLELGPLEELVSDVSVSEIAVVGHERISFVRNGRAASAEFAFSCAAAVRWAVARLCARTDAALGRATRVDRRLPDGSTLSAIFEPNSAPLVLVTRPRRLTASLEDLVRRGTVSRAIATFLHQCLLSRLNLLIVGPRDGGTELLTAALSAAVADSESLIAAGAVGSERVGSVFIPGSTPSLAETLALAARAPLSRLFAELSSAALTQAVIGAACDGCDGIVAIRSASSVQRGLLRISAELRGRFGEGAPHALAGAFEVVVEIARLRDDRHRVLRVAEVLSADDGEIELSDVFTFAIDRTAAGGLIEGSFMPATNMPAVADLMRTRGALIDSALFTRPPSR